MTHCCVTFEMTMFASRSLTTAAPRGGAVGGTSGRAHSRCYARASRWPWVIIEASPNGQRSMRARQRVGGLVDRGDRVQQPAQRVASLGRARELLAQRVQPACECCVRVCGAACAAQPAANGRGGDAGVTRQRSVSCAAGGADERLSDGRDDIAAVGQQEARQQRVCALAAPATAATHPQPCRGATMAHQARVGRPRRQPSFAARAARVRGQLRTRPHARIATASSLWTATTSIARQRRCGAPDAQRAQQTRSRNERPRRHRQHARQPASASRPRPKAVCVGPRPASHRAVAATAGERAAGVRRGGLRPRAPARERLCKTLRVYTATSTTTTSSTSMTLGGPYVLKRRGAPQRLLAISCG